MQIPVAILALSWGLLGYTIYLFLASLVRSRRDAALAKKLGCAEPPVQVNPGRRSLPLGLDHLFRAFEADQAQQFPSDVYQRMIDTGAITFSYRILGSLSYFTADEKNIQTILAISFQDFELGPNRAGNFWPLLGNGIFTQDGAAWEHSRAMMRPQFVREQVSDLELEECHVQNLMKAIDVSLKSDKWTDEVDLSTLFFRLTLDSATEFLFGQSVQSQIQLTPGYKGDVKESDANFAVAFDKAQMSLATRARFSDKYWLSNPKGFKENCKVCHDFIDHFVRIALSKDLEKESVTKANGKERYVFLDALARQTRDPIELRSQMLHILLAGRDTTASHLGWLFMSLSKDPIRYKKLRNIIIEEFGTYDNPKEITFSKLKSCQYLQHCNNESLRLYPVVPVNSRMANKNTTLPTGGGKDGKSKLFIPKGMQVDYSVHAMHRRKDIWGEDADQFRPERWEGRKVGWEFLPFNGGPRICIGQQFALTEAAYVAVRMLQRFDKMENLETDPIIRHNLTLTNCSGNGVKVRAHAVQ